MKQIMRNKMKAKITKKKIEQEKPKKLQNSRWV